MHLGKQLQRTSVCKPLLEMTEPTQESSVQLLYFPTPFLPIAQRMQQANCATRLLPPSALQPHLAHHACASRTLGTIRAWHSVHTWRNLPTSSSQL